MKSFLKVPQKVHHGLLLVSDLAERYGSDEPLTLAEIAEKERISQGFLEEIAALLRSGGIIEGRRGAGGGYVLAKDPSALTVADVITAIEGPVALVDCLADMGACALSSRCTNRNVWSAVQNQILSLLSTMTIARVLSPLSPPPVLASRSAPSGGPQSGATRASVVQSV